jgi:hypothetical protein
MRQKDKSCLDVAAIRHRRKFLFFSGFPGFSGLRQAARCAQLVIADQQLWESRLSEAQLQLDP